MRRKIIRVGETEIYFHLATLVYFIYALMTNTWRMLVVSHGSVLLHEFAHAAVSAMMGNPPREIEVSPIGAIMRLEDDLLLPMPRRMLVLAAGPIMSFLLCLGAYVLTKHGMLWLDLGRMLFLSNLTILLVNMMPVLPLDGGRMLASILSTVCSAGSVAGCMRVLGRVIGSLLTLAGIWYAWKQGTVNLTLIMLGCFIVYSSTVSTAARAMTELREFLERRICLERKEIVACRWIAVLANSASCDVLRGLPAGCVCMIRVLERGSLKMLGDIDEFSLTEAYLKNPSGTVRDAIMNI